MAKEAIEFCIESLVEKVVFKKARKEVKESVSTLKNEYYSNLKTETTFAYPAQGRI